MKHLYNMKNNCETFLENIWKNLFICLSFIKHIQLEIILSTRTSRHIWNDAMWYINLNVCVVIVILEKLKETWNFAWMNTILWRSNHQITDVVKHLYTYPGHFMDIKYPEILASAFNYRELLIKEKLLMQEQQPEINVENFLPLYTSSIRRLLRQIFGWRSVLMLIHVLCIVVGVDVHMRCYL